VTRLEYQTVAKCRPEHVWQVFADVDRWSQWNPVIGNSGWISGEPWKLGSKFFMEILQPRRMSFKPTITDISAPNHVVWTGTAPGFKGTHGHEFTGQGDGTTLVKTWEEFSGWATWFFTAGMRQRLLKMYAAWLDSLSREAEKLARSQTASR
jgi:hypothetical protein